MLFNPVVVNEIGKINFVSERIVNTELHDAYTFILQSLIKM